MIVKMEYAEPEPWRGRMKSAVVTRQTQGWHLATYVGGVMDWSRAGLDRREAMQMARRWVETGER